MNQPRTVSGRPVLPAYANAVLSTAVAVLARVFFEHAFSYNHPYVTLYLAVLWSAWYGGLGPALVSTALGAAAAFYLFLPPLRIIASAESDFLGLEFYLIVSVSVAVLTHILHVARHREARSARVAEQRLAELQRETAERSLAEERLRQAQKFESIGLLAGGIAHDFNNLLTGIIGNAILATHALPPEDTARTYLDQILNAAERSANLVRQLLAYAGKGAFRVQTLQLPRIVADALDAIRPSIPRNIELRLELGPDLAPVQGDPNLYRQMVTNLVTNAVEAVAERDGFVAVSTGEIRIEEGRQPELAIGAFTAGGMYVYVQVSDSGTGMSPETIERIFDPFFTTKFMGRGLGLAAVSGIIRTHRGGLEVRSVLGQGSTFTVYLPAVEDAREAGPQSSPGPASVQKANSSSPAPRSPLSTP